MKERHKEKKGCWPTEEKRAGMSQVTWASSREAGESKETFFSRASRNEHSPSTP